MPFTVAAVLLALALSPPPQDAGKPAGARPRNLLIVTFDTTRRDFMGFLGKSPSPTPNLDRLAKKSFVFTDAYTVAPLTLPAHASLMTGLYPVSHGVHENTAFKLPQSAHTLAEILKEHGYATGAAVAAFVLDPMFGLDQGFDRYRSPPKTDATATSLVSERRADQQADLALADLTELSKQAPFFYWVHFFDPHYPYAAPEHLLPTPGELEAKEGVARHAYFEELHYADKQFGRLLDQLEAKGIAQDLVIVFAADHGESLGDTPESSHGYFLFDPTVRIPLLIVDPKLPARTIDTQVSLIDVVPTVLDLIGLDPIGAGAPSHDAPVADKFDGVDLAPLLRDPNGDAPERALLLESWFAWLNYGWAPFDGCVQSSFKYLHSARDELFDRAHDPREEKNLFDPKEPRSLAFVRQLKALLAPTLRLVKDRLQLTAADQKYLQSLGYAIANDGANLDADLPVDRAQLPDAYTKAPLIKRLEEVVRARAADDSKRAVELLRELATQEPNSASLHEQLGTLLHDFGRDHLDEAEQHLKRVLELDPRRAHAFYMLALCAADRSKAALDELRSLRDRGDTSPAAVESSRKLAKESRTQADRAIVLFHASLEIEPDATDCLSEFVHFLEAQAERTARTKQTAKAKEQYGEVVALFDRLLKLLPADAPHRRELESLRTAALVRGDELANDGK